jgi:chemotaxis protein CheD
VLIVTDKTHLTKTEGKEHFLHPGDFYFSKAPEKIGTILGSCIAISLWHPELKIGGMCHFVLPKSHNKTVKLDGRYANDAIRLFEHSVKSHRTSLSDYQAKIFGGGNHLPHQSDKEDSVGIKNAEVAMTLLIEKNVDIMVADVGETWARRIIFELETGDVWVKKQ